jgi:hypothetical protein
LGRQGQAGSFFLDDFHDFQEQRILNFEELVPVRQQEIREKLQVEGGRAESDESNASTFHLGCRMPAEEAVNPE